MIQSPKNRLKANEYIEGILAQNMVVISKAITLVESRLDSDIILAQEVLEKLLPYTGKSLRIGITGVPGVGKSTFIEVLGNYVTQLGKRLAVLAVDPSSQRSKGSILGDKTRMASLASNPMAFIRPSPSQNVLGGLTQRTRQTLLVCEAAGYEVIFIETVGVGQSETIVSEMVDCFLLLMLAGAGDELQGIKKGIMEMADLITITKADGQNIEKASIAKNEYQNALHLFPKNEYHWYPQVMTCSALDQTGIKEIWDEIERFLDHMKRHFFFEQKRNRQRINWFYDAVRENLESSFFGHPLIKAHLAELLERIKEGTLPPTQAAFQLSEIYRNSFVSKT